MEQAERNIVWILAVSIIMYFGFSYLNLPNFFSPFARRDAWYYLAITNTLFFILTITSSALYKAKFCEIWTYKLSIVFFIASMVLLFVQYLKFL